jgi:hypothetical protein
MLQLWGSCQLLVVVLQQHMDEGHAYVHNRLGCCTVAGHAGWYMAMGLQRSSGGWPAVACGSLLQVLLSSAGSGGCVVDGCVTSTSGLITRALLVGPPIACRWPRQPEAAAAKRGCSP